MAGSILGRKEQMSMAWFYEIRTSSNAVLKRDGGFAAQDAAKLARREDARKMKSSCQPDRTDAISVNENHILRLEFLRHRARAFSFQQVRQFRMPFSSCDRTRLSPRSSWPRIQCVFMRLTADI
jgi:hypothetical protein